MQAQLSLSGLIQQHMTRLSRPGHFLQVREQDAFLCLHFVCMYVCMYVCMCVCMPAVNAWREVLFYSRACVA